jgi:hypothetical protein
MNRRRMWQPWQHACKLILTARRRRQITRQLSLALFVDAKLDLGHKRAPAYVFGEAL